MTYYTLIRETWPKARTPHRCIWCGETIPVGMQHCHEVSHYGGLQDHRWHAECRDAGMCYVDDEGAEFIPYDNERPSPNGPEQRKDER